MASNSSNYTGVAQEKEYINVHSEEFYCDGRTSYRIVVTLIDRVPHVGIRRFWYSFERQGMVSLEKSCILQGEYMEYIHGLYVEQLWCFETTGPLR